MVPVLLFVNSINRVLVQGQCLEVTIEPHSLDLDKAPLGLSWLEFPVMTSSQF